ncbi:Hsp20/alpha crystallin family protein [Rhodanobacter ginsengisoli]|uniref:Hsp20/alpha crystallin family protein n=1 Tax=Rhodanobacter ginsengisoli TaxID=418646 RepID=A0ABW0QMI5_9GAMM
MTTLTHWNPLKATSRFDPLTSFEDMFRSLAARPQWRDLEAAPDMRIDVSEDDKAFHIKAEIPGVDKNDIELSVDGNQVSISAEVKRETRNKKDEAEIYTERYYGKVYRSFTLPGEFDSAKAEARCDNGVLSLDLPKRPNGSARKIAVS